MTLNPLTLKKIKRFKSIKRGYTSLIIFSTFIFISIFAEVFVHVDETARRKGWGRACLKALCASLVKQGTTPIYVVDEENHASQDLAMDVGFTDTGAREVFAQVSRTS